MLALHRLLVGPQAPKISRPGHTNSSLNPKTRKSRRVKRHRACRLSGMCFPLEHLCLWELTAPKLGFTLGTGSKRLLLYRPERQRVLVLDEDAVTRSDRISVSLALSHLVKSDLFELWCPGLKDNQ